MKRQAFFAIALFLAMGLQEAKAQVLPDRQATLEILKKVNGHFMSKHPDCTRPSYVGKLRPSNIWTRSVYYEGLLALYAIYPLADYYNYAYEWAEFHKWGLSGGCITRNADNQCCGQVYIDLYRLCPDPRKLQAINATMEMMVNTPQVDDWTWVDALQMAMPVMAKMGRLKGDRRYWDKMWEMYAHTHGGFDGNSGLFCAEQGLWWRDSRFCPPYREPNGSNCFWSRGNGWVYAALVRTLSELPADETHRKDYEADFLAMSQAIKRCQRADGLWNVSLHDPNHFGGPETSGTSLFVYGMAWGVRTGLLDREDYLPVLLKAWNGMLTVSLHDDGFLGYMQGSGKEPKDSQPVTYDSVPDFEDYGVGCFLLAGTEVYKLK